jgi:hypothetical protein
VAGGADSTHFWPLPDTEEGGFGEQYFEGVMQGYKTSISVAKKTSSLPVVVPLCGVSGVDLIGSFLETREQCGLDDIMSIDAHRLVKASLRNVSSHSLKATWPTALGKFGTPLEERRLLGYQVIEGAASAQSYNRDNLATPFRSLVTVVGLVVSGQFLPDASRAERILPFGRAPVCLEKQVEHTLGTAVKNVIEKQMCRGDVPLTYPMMRTAPVVSHKPPASCRWTLVRMSKLLVLRNVRAETICRTTPTQMFSRRLLSLRQSVRMRFVRPRCMRRLVSRLEEGEVPRAPHRLLTWVRLSDTWSGRQCTFGTWSMTTSWHAADPSPMHGTRRSLH